MSMLFDYLDNLPLTNVETRTKGGTYTSYVHHNLPDGQINGAYRLHCNSQNIEPVVQEIETFYNSFNKRFHIKLTSQNALEEQFLVNRGYHLVSDCYLLGFQLPEEPVELKNSIPDNLRIAEISLQQLITDSRIINILIRTFGGDAESTIALMKEQAQSRIVHPHFVAFLNNEPVCYASLEIPPDYHTVRLDGAATLKEYRGRGVYTTITEYRLQYLQKLGKQFVIIDADKKTSAPILQNYGFEIIDEIREYALVQSSPIEY